MNILWVGIGGAFGAVCRYFISITLFTSSSFPYATLTINLLGSLLLGLLSASFFLKKQAHRLMLTTGFLGAFTTFSTFSMETIEFVLNDEWRFAIFYVVSSIIGGWICAWIGFTLARGRVR